MCQVTWQSHGPMELPATFMWFAFPTKWREFCLTWESLNFIGPNELPSPVVCKQSWVDSWLPPLPTCPFHHPCRVALWRTSCVCSWPWSGCLPSVSWSKWLTSPTLARWQFEMKATEWADWDRRGQSKMSDGGVTGRGWGWVIWTN